MNIYSQILEKIEMPVDIFSFCLCSHDALDRMSMCCWLEWFPTDRKGSGAWCHLVEWHFCARPPERIQNNNENSLLCVMSAPGGGRWKQRRPQRFIHSLLMDCCCTSTCTRTHTRASHTHAAGATLKITATHNKYTQTRGSCYHPHIRFVCTGTRRMIFAIASGTRAYAADVYVLRYYMQWHLPSKTYKRINLCCAAVFATKTTWAAAAAAEWPISQQSQTETWTMRQCTHTHHAHTAAVVLCFRLRVVLLVCWTRTRARELPSRPCIIWANKTRASNRTATQAFTSTATNGVVPTSLRTSIAIYSSRTQRKQPISVRFVFFFLLHICTTKKSLCVFFSSAAECVWLHTDDVFARADLVEQQEKKCKANDRREWAKKKQIWFCFIWWNICRWCACERTSSSSISNRRQTSSASSSSHREHTNLHIHTQFDAYVYDDNIRARDK